MLRTWSYAWWRPVVGILTMVVGGLIVFPLVLIPILFIGVAIEGGEGSYGDRVEAAASLTSVTPSSMLYLNLALASLTVLAMLIVRVVHGMRPRWLASVRPGIRWRFLWACAGLSVVALVVSTAISLLLPSGPQDTVSGQAAFPTGQLLATTVVILLTTPLQAIGEEYAFRGYLMQAFGSLLGPWPALVATSVLFAFAHGAQNFPLFFDRFAFGMIAGTTVILLGGLEAGIALHVVNNLVAFGFAIAFDQLSGTLTVSEASWWQLPVTVVQNGLYLVLVLLVARRMGLERTSSPPQVERSGVPHTL
ncbi:hypothetical protein ASG49_11830 [Marmoricola sp. Leaf446]|nr:hypothetical protein ASG49_11830 [Marmoricola sp. Leaf446]